MAKPFLTNQKLPLAISQFMLKNHPDEVNVSNIPPICDVSEIVKRFLSISKIFDF